MKNKFQLISLKEFFTGKRIFLALLSLLFLYWGTFSTFLKPIMEAISQPSTSSIILAILKIFILSGLCVGIGSVFAIMSITRPK
jgi:hypothetical protein